MTICLSLSIRVVAASALAVVLTIHPFFPIDHTQASLGGTVITPIAINLHNPRGINFGPDGALYVAEAGGDGVSSGLCGVMGDGSTKCSANTGSINRIDPVTFQTDRIVKNIPSLIAPNGTGNGATGVHDIAFNGNEAVVTIGLGGNPKWRFGYFGAQGSSYARLARFTIGGKFRLGEDLGRYEAAANPDGFVPDSNPYGLLLLGDKILFADAGGNDVNLVQNGIISTLTVLPDRLIALPPPAPPGTMVSVQAVPTSIALGPDGNVYVGQLTGGPFTVGAANVYRFPVGGGAPVLAQSGFTNIIDIAFGPDGSLYVLEIAKNAIPNFNPGRLVKIAPNGTRTEIAAGSLIAPGGIAVAADGTLYVTNRSTSPTIGEVLRIVP